MSSEPRIDLAVARRATEIEMGEDRLAPLYAGLAVRRRERRNRRIAVGASLTMLLVAGGLSALRSPPTPPSVAVHPVDPATGSTWAGTLPLQLSDGITLRSPGAPARVLLAELSPARVRLELLAGTFAVDQPAAARETWVEVSSYRVIIQAASISIARDGDGSFQAELRTGRGEVIGPDGSRVVLQPCVRASFGMPVAAAPSPPEAAPAPFAPEKAHVRQHPRPAPSAPGPGWRALAAEGQYGSAFDQLKQSGPSALHDTADDLILAADAARLSDHPEEAAGYLRRVVEQYGRDAHAPLAAFTLGSLYLHKLGQPARAAEAYAQSRRLDRTGSVSEDAQAREVEALTRAGQSEQARELAQAYLRDHPHGRWAAPVRRWANLGE